MENGLEFPTIPEEFKLTKLEERLVPPSFSFYAIERNASWWSNKLEKVM